jgi:hypothetical protein
MEVIMALYIELKRVADDGKRATYSFATLDGPIRLLIFDREEERIWPVDETQDVLFQNAARKVVRTWRENRELPETMAYQA